MNFLQRTPFFRLLLPLVAGIVLYTYFSPLSLWLIVAIFAVSIGIFIASFLIRDTNKQYAFRWLFGSGVALFLVALAFVLTAKQDSKSNFDYFGQRTVFRVELTSAPVEKANSYMCEVELLQIIDSTEWKTASGTAIIYLQKDSIAANLLYGDRLLIETEFSPPERALNPNGFDYGAYLKRQGIGATSYVSSERWQKTDFNDSFSIFRLADICQNYLLNIYREFGIKGDEFAVLAALTLGYTDALHPDLRQSYSATGAVHILAVSGLHVGIVYAAIAFLLGFIGKTRRQRILKSILVILFLWAYAFITGLSPSVMRSAFMFSFVAFATCLERRSQIFNTIFMSAFFMLLINPNFLFSIGFQLSYSAVLSIIVFTVPASKVMKTKNKAVHWCWDLFMVSFAAQLGTAPFILYYFHQFPVYFLLTNFVAIPLSTVVIYSAIALLGTSFIPFVSMVVAFVLKWLLVALNSSIVFIQHLPSSLAFIAIDSTQMWLLVLMIFMFTAYYFTKRYHMIFIGLSAFLLVCALNLHTHYQTLVSKKMVVYAGQNHTHVSFIDGYKNFVYTTDSMEIERIATAFWQNNKLSAPLYNKDDTPYFSDGFAYFANKRILILTDNFLKGKTTSSPIELDYLIIGQDAKPNMPQLLQCVQPQHVVIDKGTTKWYSNHIKETCEENDIVCYEVGEKGAFVLKIFP